MPQVFNVYCDESCHLENDGLGIMVLGGIWCELEKTRGVLDRIHEIKERHGLKRSFEVKWNKVSPGKLRFYSDLIDYFFDDDDLHFRALIVSDKRRLVHGAFRQNHDTWYYKMYFDMLKVILDPESKYRIYLDIKDSKGAEKVEMLWKVLCSNMYDFSREILEKMQVIRSDEVGIMQLSDLLIGAVCYCNRGLTTSPAKLQLVQRIKHRSSYSLTRTTLLRERKFNLFKWNPQEVQG